DLASPRLADVGDADRVAGRLTVRPGGPELLEQRGLQLRDLIALEGLRPDLDGRSVAGADGLHRFGFEADGVAEDGLDVLDGDARHGRHLDAGAALEVDTPAESAQQHAEQGDQHDHRGDDVPPLAASDDL